MIALIISAIILKVSYKASLAESVTSRDFIVGGLCFSSMYCSNLALKFVNYPFMVLAKSAKIMPVILIGSIRKVYIIQKSQYVLAFFITMGLIMFNWKKV